MISSYTERKEGPKWVEIWTIEACGEQWKVPVLLYSNNYTKDVIVGTKDVYKVINAKVDQNKFWVK